MIRFLNAALALGAALALPALPAAAQQSRSGGDGRGPPASERPAPTLPEAKLPGSSSPDRSGTMSEDLSRSGGVIEPPAAVDPAIKQPTPSPGPRSMPVIPPPGTPGGNPNVEPK
jgi:hypothetical protein